MGTCPKCGVLAVAEGARACTCRNNGPRLVLVKPRQPRVTPWSEVRPFLVAGFVFFLLLVGTELTAGYYARAAGTGSHVQAASAPAARHPRVNWELALQR